MKPWAAARAAGLFAAATESSRSTITTSAPEAMPFARLRSESPGTNKSDCMSGGPLADHGVPPAFRDKCTILIEGPVLELDDPAVRSRLRFAHADHLRLDADRVAMKDRVREDGVGHPQIGDRGAERRIVNRD